MIRLKAIFGVANQDSGVLPVASLNHPWGRSLIGESGSPAKSQVSVRVRALPPIHRGVIGNVLPRMGETGVQFP